MPSSLKDQMVDIRLNWQHLRWLARWVRGATRDRTGRWYWRFEEEWKPGHFQIGLIAWPGFTYYSDTAGWLSMAREEFEDGPFWMIHDVRVQRPRNQQRGVGTALVHAAITLARRHGAKQLNGFVTPDDAKASPFLPTWYAKLGFTVQQASGDTAARFWMDFPSPR